MFGKFNIGSWLALIGQLAIPAVLTIEAVHGQAVAGADKKTLATTALAGATQAALALFPDGSQNAAYAKAASAFASAAIDAAVTFTKSSGDYSKASAAAVSAQPAQE